MDRKEFLGLVGTSIGAIVLVSCLQSCKKQNNSPTAPTVDFTLDLNSSTNSALLSNGGYLYSNGVIVAKTTTGTFIAVSQACTHQGSAIIFQPVGNSFKCNSHGASFASNGTVTNGPANSNLKQYTCTLTGTSLRVNG